MRKGIYRLDSSRSDLKSSLLDISVIKCDPKDFWSDLECYRVNVIKVVFIILNENYNVYL